MSFGNRHSFQESVNWRMICAKLEPLREVRVPGGVFLLCDLNKKGEVLVECLVMRALSHSEGDV